MSSHYGKFALVLLASAAAMYAISYAMIASFDHFYFSINKGYMVLMMVGVMALIMLFGMRSMYGNSRLNYVLYAGFAGLLIVSFLLARAQTMVGNEAFLRSMIPHHSMAILICEEAPISDPEIVELCGEIIRAQREEIARMEDILTRY